MWPLVGHIEEVLGQSLSAKQVLDVILLGIGCENKPHEIEIKVD